MTRTSSASRRPPLLDLLVAVLIVALLGGLVALQALLGDDGAERAQEEPGGSGGPVAHSSLGPSSSQSVTPAALGSPSGSSSGSPTATAAPAPTATLPTATPGQRLAPDASALASAAQSAAARPTMFRVATFNLLGASHTRRGGDSRLKRSYAERLPHAVRLLEHHQVEVVGFQEFEPPQRDLFDRLVGGRWARFPAGGDETADGRRAIAWRTDVWELVDTGSVPVPYFGGSTVRTPVVLLQYRATGRRVWFLNVHNPASGCAVCGGSNDRWRAAALQREIEAIGMLNADGTPVVFTGDMNAKAAFFCTIAAALPVRFANGGSYGPEGCAPPRPTPIDWIVGTREVSFSGYVSDRGPLNRLASDHALYAATAMVLD